MKFKKGKPKKETKKMKKLQSNKYNEQPNSNFKHPFEGLKSQEIVEIILNHIPDMVFIFDGEGEIHFANKKACERLGYRKDEMKGMHIMGLHPREIHKQAQKVLQDIFTQAESTCTFPLKSKNNEIIPIQTKVSPLTLDLPNIEREMFIGTSREPKSTKTSDIGSEEVFDQLCYEMSKTKDLDKILWKITNTLVKNLHEVDAAGIYLTNQDGDLILKSHVGLSEKFIEQKKLMKADSKQALLIQNGVSVYANYDDLPFNDLLRSEGIQTISTHPFIIDNKIIAVLNTCSFNINDYSSETRKKLEYISNHSGNHIQRAIYSHDLLKMNEKLNRQNEILRTNEQKIRMITENTGVGIGVIKNNKIDYINQTAEEILELNKNEVLGRDVREFLPPLPSRTQKIMKKILKKQFSDSQRIKTIKNTLKIHTYKTNKVIWIEMEIKPIEFENEEPGLIITLVDITEMVEKKTFLEESEKLIKILHEQELKNLKNIEKLKRDFIYRASHELKTPLNAIKSTSNLLSKSLEEKLTRRENELFYLIQKGARRLKNLIDSILDSLRIEGGRFSIEKTPTEPEKIINEIIDTFRDSINKRNHQMEIIIDPKIPKIMVDRTKIKQVLANILVNAINYTPPRGKIKIMTINQEENIQFIIKDNGIGITASEMPKIFNRASKIEHQNINKDIINEGVGLGLYLAKKIVEFHGGKIWAESKGRGRGAKFFFQIPKKRTLD